MPRQRKLPRGMRKMVQHRKIKVAPDQLGQPRFSAAISE
jgi:hypothetical protein